jgi:glycosyltransferase involved in cell wall biosynthesis
MSKRIMVISPVPSHPQNAGNRARVYNLLTNLRNTGYVVYFVYIQETPGDEKSMQQYWGNKFYSIPYRRPQTAFKKPLTGLYGRILGKVQSIVGTNSSFNYMIDDWYDDSINETLIRLSREIDPDIVIVEYVFFSKALECFGKKVLKIIDTHDIFADRYKLYLKNNQTPQWYSTTESEEDKGLKRADVIIAIQQKEANVFSKRLKDKKIITVGHLVSLHPYQKRNSKNTILFIGSSNPINIYGINYFIKNVFPQIKSRFRDAQLILVGEICNEVDSFDGCLKLGSIENLEYAYDLADLVINPILFGTGLKIKNIEALGYSKPLITTPVGAEGMEEGAGSAFLVADSPEKFVQIITKLFLDTELYENLSRGAYNFAKEWNQRYLKALTDILE